MAEVTEAFNLSSELAPGRLERSSVNVVASMVGYVVPMLVSLATTPVLLRWLGEAAFGLQSLVAVIIGYLTVMDMGLDLPIVKLLAEDHARGDASGEQRLLNTTLQLYACVGVVGLLVIVFAAEALAHSVFRVPPELQEEAVWVFRLAGAGFLASVFLSWGRAVTMGLQRFDLCYGVFVVTNVAGVGFGLAAVHAGRGVSGYVLVRVLVSLGGGLGYWWLAKRSLPHLRLRWDFDRGTLRRVARYVGYGTANRAIGSAVSRLDQTLIGVWWGVAAAGIYALPLMIVSSLGYMIAYMLGFLFPLASELHSLGQLDRLREILTKAMRFMAGLATMAFVPVAIFGDRFLELWVGGNVAEQASMALRLLAVAGYLGTLTVSLTNNVLIGIGNIRQFTMYATVRAVVLGIACVVCIRPLGLTGAGVGLLIATMVDACYFVIVLGRYFDMSVPRVLKEAYLKALALGLALALIAVVSRRMVNSWSRLVMVVGVLEAGYVIAGYRIGVFCETERRALLGLWQVAPRMLWYRGRGL